MNCIFVFLQIDGHLLSGSEGVCIQDMRNTFRRRFLVIPTLLLHNNNNLIIIHFANISWLPLNGLHCLTDFLGNGFHCV